MHEPLKPCPFCAASGKLVAANLTATTWVVSCLDCGIEGTWSDRQIGAVDAWNTRPREAMLIDPLRAARTLIYVLDAEAQDRQWKSNVLDLIDRVLAVVGQPVVLAPPDATPRRD